MSTKLYVGNLPWTSNDAELASTFGQAGAVVSAKVMVDKFSGRSRGFAFVEMETEEGANKAIEMFHGQDMGGRALTVNIARPMEPRAPGAGGGFRGGSRGPREGGYGDNGGGYNG